MKAFADWASSRPLRLGMLVILCLILPLPVSPALLALYALRRGPSPGLLATGLTIGAVAAFSLLTGAPANQVGIVTAALLLYLVPAAAFGALLAWSRNFSFVYQAAVLGSLLAIFVVSALIPEVAQIGSLVRDTWLEIISSLGAPQEMLDAVEATPGEAYASALLASLFVTAIAAGILGFWWFALIQDGVGFGEQFRNLRLGRVTSIVMVIATLIQVVPYAPFGYLGPVALVGFLFPGLAVLHARVCSDSWPRSVPVLVYVLMFFPVTSPLVVYGLSAVGLLDNFFDLRARAGTDG